MRNKYFQRLKICILEVFALSGLFDCILSTFLSTGTAQRFYDLGRGVGIEKKRTIVGGSGGMPPEKFENYKPA